MNFEDKYNKLVAHLQWLEADHNLPDYMWEVTNDLFEDLGIESTYSHEDIKKRKLSSDIKLTQAVIRLNDVLDWAVDGNDERQPEELHADIKQTLKDKGEYRE